MWSCDGGLGCGSSGGFGGMEQVVDLDGVEQVVDLDGVG